jgi:opacity protein-like surface antigen
MFTSPAGRAMLLATIVTSAASAQAPSSADGPSAGLSELVRRSSASISFVQERPQGALRQNVGLGYGVDGAYLFRLDRAGIWSVRASAGVASYGHESRRTPFSESVGGRVTVDVTTTNYVVPMSIGPQLSWPTGSFRPYVNVGVGGQAFVTESRVEDTGSFTTLASTTNHSSIAAAWTVGGGVYMPLYVGRMQVQLDMGAQYFNGGTTRYLAPGSIVDLPDARISVTPLESRTQTAIVRLGLRVQP